MNKSNLLLARRLEVARQVLLPRGDAARTSRALPAQRTGLATRDKTHLRGLKTLIFHAFHGGGLLCETLFAFVCVVANSIRPILFKQPLTQK